MNTVFYRRLSILVSVAAITVLGGGLSAQAKTTDTVSTDASTAITTQETPSSTPTPIPGTTVTSAAALTSSEPATSQIAPSSETANSKVAQIDVDPGQSTRGGASYIGVAGNIGLGGDSALGEGSFMVISKIGFTRTISARPSVAIENDPVILIPVTYDFARQSTEAFEERFPVAVVIRK